MFDAPCSWFGTFIHILYITLLGRKLSQWHSQLWSTAFGLIQQGYWIVTPLNSRTQPPATPSCRLELEAPPNQKAWPTTVQQQSTTSRLPGCGAQSVVCTACSPVWTQSPASGTIWSESTAWGPTQPWLRFQPIALPNHEVQPAVVPLHRT